MSTMKVQTKQIELAQIDSASGNASSRPSVSEISKKAIMIRDTYKLYLGGQNTIEIYRKKED